MVNQCILVGKVEAVTFGQTRSNVVLSVETYDENAQTYDTQKIPVLIGEALTKSMGKIKEKTTIGVKGRLVVDDKTLQVEARKLTFISGKKGYES